MMAFSEPRNHYKICDNVEAIDVIEHVISVCDCPSDAYAIGNALKYLIRCTRKGTTVEDLKKAKAYIEHVVNAYETLA
jgi:hypothetical protein